MVETFKEYFFEAHKVSPFVFIIFLIATLIFKEWLFFLIGIVTIPLFYLFLYYCYKKSMLKYEEDSK